MGVATVGVVGSATVSVVRQAVALIAEGEPGLTVAVEAEDPAAALVSEARRLSPEARRRLTDKAAKVLGALIVMAAYLLRSRSIEGAAVVLALALAVADLLNEIDSD